MSDDLIGPIVLNPALTVPQKSDKLTRTLYAQPGHGIAQAVECLQSTHHQNIAVFASDYLALMPDRREDKNRVAARLRQEPDLVIAAARLVPWLETDLLSRFIDDYVAKPDPRSGLYSVIFDIASYQPALLRPHVDAFSSPSVRRGLLSGAPNDWVDQFLRRWREDADAEALDAIARVRTPHAADVIEGLRDDVEDRSQWECWLEMAGRLPESSGPSILTPSFLGLAVEQGSAHRLGGATSGSVPLCPICDTPSEAVLRLSAEALPYSLSGDPCLFWYACGCNALDFTTVQDTGKGRHIYFGPAGEAAGNGRLVPAPCCLQLEPHPNQTGISLDTTGGFARHQVGGQPAFIKPVALPHCPSCQRPMPFVASVDSGMTPFGPLGFTGTLFGFWCNDCRVTTTRRQA